MPNDITTVQRDQLRNPKYLEAYLRDHNSSTLIAANHPRSHRTKCGRSIPRRGGTSL